MAVRTLNSTARIESSEPGYGLTDADFNIRYEGATLGTWERNGYDDSDFYALVWTGEALTSVEYATTRGWTYANGANVDATDEVKAAAGAWLAARDIESWNLAAAHDALMVEKGREVEVVRGRKVPIGTTGTVIWVGPSKYQRGAQRVGLKDAAGEAHWTAETNLRVTDAATRITTAEEIVERTDARIKRLVETGTASDWASAYRSYGGNLNVRANGVSSEDIAWLLEDLGRGKLDVAAIREAIRIREINERHGAEAILEARYGERFMETVENLSTSALQTMVENSLAGDDELIKSFATKATTGTDARSPEPAGGTDAPAGGLIGMARKIDGA